MVNLDQLRRKRGVLSAGVTRALTQLTDLLQRADPDLSEVHVHLDYLKDKEPALSRLDDAIIPLTGEDDVDCEDETVQDYSDNISYAIARVKYWLQGRQQATTTHAEGSGSETSRDPSMLRTMRESHVTDRLYCPGYRYLPLTATCVTGRPFAIITMPRSTKTSTYHASKNSRFVYVHYWQR